MPLQNRVTPFGNIVADPSRNGLFMGNRGILHGENKALGPARWQHANWLICRLDFKNRKRTPMTPGRYTELFFLDEAVALAAGHRPCAECRRERFNAYMAAWREVCADLAPPRAKPADRALHAARVDSRTRRQIVHAAKLGDLPDGAIVDLVGDGSAAHLLWRGALYPYSLSGYGAPVRQPKDRAVTVLTPSPTVNVLKAGYRPEIHPSARCGG